MLSVDYLVNNLNEGTAVSQDTVAMLEKAKAADEVLDADKRILNIWKAYKFAANDAAASGIKGNTESYIKDYIQNYFKNTNPIRNGELDNINSRTFEDGLRTAYDNCVNNAKQCKIAMKNAEKAACNDINVGNDLYNYIYKNCVGSKNELKMFRLERFNEYGLTKNAKIAVATGIIAATALLTLGVVKVCKHFFGKDEAPAGNPNMPKADNTVSVPVDTLQIQKSDTTAVDKGYVEEETVQQDSVAGTVAVPGILTENAAEVIAADTLKLVKTDAVTQEEEKNQTDEVEQTAKNEQQSVEERRQAFELAVTKFKNILSVEGLKSDSYTIVKGDSFWKIAKKTLMAEGISNPTSNEIIKRIALLAIINDIDKVTEYKLQPNKPINVPSCEMAAYINGNREIGRALETIAGMLC